MKSLNLGILAHVDAGKTSLTERLLHAAGVIDEIGNVDDGNTHTDTLALEQERGITIRSAVVSFTIDDVRVNLIDTPGHSDFIAEVERALAVLDGAVLVVSAVEGVQAQTRVLMRALQRIRIPTLVFINKIDRAGADPDAVLASIRDTLTPHVVSMATTREAGSRVVEVEPYDGKHPAFAASLIELLAAQDDEILSAWVEGDGMTPARLRAALRRQTRRALVHPVFVGSARTGTGVATLSSGIADLLPSREPADQLPLSATVFKVERGRAGEKVAYLRICAGRLQVRERVPVPAGEARVTAVRVFEQGAVVDRDSAGAGEIAQVWGLASVQVGDAVGAPPTGSPVRHRFSPPSLETVVDPVDRANKGILHAALTQLAEQDPLINVRQDDEQQEISVSLYGEVQKEVIGATLAREYAVAVTFRETTTVCVERLVGTGEAVEVIDTESNPFLATVGLRLEPGPRDSGFRFGLEVEPGSMPPAFFTAVEESARASLRRGLHGWEVLDCRVTMTRSGYWARQSHAHGTFDASMSSTAGDFRGLTRLVLQQALRDAGTRVEEPIHEVELEVPADTIGTTMRALAQVRGVPLDSRVSGTSYLVTGEVPAAQVHVLGRLLPTLTRGEGVLVSRFARHRAVRGAVSIRS